MNTAYKIFVKQHFLNCFNEYVVVVVVFVVVAVVIVVVVLVVVAVVIVVVVLVVLVHSQDLKETATQGCSCNCINKN